MKKIVISTLLSLSFLILKGQYTDLGSTGPTRIIGPNPEAAKIATYGKYDISYYTGKPDISIPVYTIKTSDLTLPINLIYESTGLRTDDLASWVGTGWMLGGIGSISRVVVGMPDDSQGGFLFQTDIPYTGTISLTYYDEAVHYHNKDTEPDRYYFNFNGHSGEFTFDTSRNIIQIPLSGVRIRKVGNNFEITDEEGNVYEFSTRETMTMTINGDIDYIPQCTSTWWLSRITSADRSDRMNFYYSGGTEIDYKPNFSAAYGPSYTMEGTQGSSPILENKVLDNSQSVMHREYSPQRVDSITFNNGKLIFNKVADRLDGGSHRLSSIDVYAVTNNVMEKKRSVNFLTNYFLYTGSYSNYQVFYSSSSGRYRLKLTGMEERKGDGTLNGTYNFDYDTTQNVPAYRGTYQQDYWGYYNGETGNDVKQTLMPVQTTADYQYTIGGANREPNPDYIKAGILKKITYPTGGYTVFNWEAHKYKLAGTTTVAHTSSSIAYGNNSGNTPHPTQVVSMTLPISDANVQVTTSISSYPHPSNPQYDNPDYQTLEENTRPNVSIVNVATGEQVYYKVNNDPTQSYSYVSGLSLPAGTYQLTTNCYANSTTAYASIVVQWHSVDSIVNVKYAGGLRIVDITNFDVNNKQLLKESYRYGANEVGYGNLSISPYYFNTLSYEKKYQYNYVSSGGTGCNTAFTTRMLYKSEPVSTMSLASGSAVIYPVVTKYVGDSLSNAGKSIYYYFRPGEELDVQRFPDLTKGEYMVSQLGFRSPLVSKEEHYKNTGSSYQLVKTIENKYVDLGVRTIPILKLGFNNEMVYLTGCYMPSITDFYAATYWLTTAKVQLDTSIVKEYDVAGTLSLQTQRTFTYDATYRSFPIDQTIINSKGETRKNTSRYPFDKSTIVGLSTSKGIVLDTMVARNILAPVIQQEDYVNTNMVLRKTNKYKIWDASQNVVKMDSVYFKLLTNTEEPRIVYDNYDAKGNILQQAKPYDVKDVYVWGYNYQYPVAKVSGSDYNTVISLLDTTIIQHPASDAQLRTELNKLRTASSLQSAQVFTYTYLPAVGISSITDASGKIIYYEYDSMQRLRLTRDQDGKILQLTDYQYKTPITQ